MLGWGVKKMIFMGVPMLKNTFYKSILAIILLGVILNIPSILAFDWTTTQQYFKFEDGSGAIASDELGVINGGFSASPTWVTNGKINEAYKTTTQWFTTNKSATGEWSIGFWGNYTDSSNSIVGDTGGASGTGFYLSGDGNFNVYNGGSGVIGLDIGNFNDANWHFFTFSYKSGNWNVTVDGVRLYTGTQAIGYHTYNISLGSRGNGNAETGGSFDEYGYYNHELTSDEVAELYNSGAGLSYVGTPAEVTFKNYVYNASVTEGTSQTFSVNITYNSSYSSTAYLIYNGTSYLATKIGTGDNITLTKTLNIPSVTTNTIYSFVWNVSTSSVYGTNWTASSTKTQTVLNLGIDNCTTNSVLIYNFTIRDEATRNIAPYINGTFNLDLSLSTYGTTNNLITYNKLYTASEQKVVCLNINLTNIPYKIDMVGDYQATGYVQKYYYIDNGTISNLTIPTQIDLHDLPTADSTSFLFTFTDENKIGVSDAIVHVFRKYIGEGVFREVERAKTDDNGQTFIHLVEEDVIYYFYIDKDSSSSYTSSNYNAKCIDTPCQITLSKSGTNTNWSIIDNEGGKYVVSTDKSTRIISMVFNLESSSLVNMTLFRFQNGGVTSVSTTSTTANSGTLTLTAPISYGNVSFFVAIFRDNTFIKSEWIDLTTNGKDYFGTFGVILAGLIVLCLVLMSVSEGIGLIIFTCLGLIIVTIMKLIDLSWLSLISIICAGGIIIYKLVSRTKKNG